MENVHSLLRSGLLEPKFYHPKPCARKSAPGVSQETGSRDSVGNSGDRSGIKNNNRKIL